MSVFNLDQQNNQIDTKIVAGLERLSQVFRILLWDKAKEQNLSPIQIQLLLFIQNHSSSVATVSYLAQEFHVTKPTISDAVKVLEQKNLVLKLPDATDTRSYTIQLTESGKEVVRKTEDYADALTKMIAVEGETDKQILWQTILSLISQLNRLNIISVQRMCFTCVHYAKTDQSHFCNLLNLPLQIQALRIDCPEFEENSR